jgi:hypothetical protein
VGKRRRDAEGAKPQPGGKGTGFQFGLCLAQRRLIRAKSQGGEMRLPRSPPNDGFLIRIGAVTFGAEPV